MRRPAALVVCPAVVVAVSGCVFGANPTARPSVVASKACGGYHIVVDNGARSEISIWIDGELVTTAATDQTADIAQIGNYPVSPMPWDVEVRRVMDGAVLFTAHLENDGSDGRRVRVTDSPGDDVALREYTC